MTKTRTYITGGFRTVAGMVDALQTVDGVGLGRPLCQEPILCAQILSGKASGIIRPHCDLGDYRSTLSAAAVQIRQISQELPPIHMGAKENVRLLRLAIAQWLEQKNTDSTGMLYQVPSIPNYIPVDPGSHI